MTRLLLAWRAGEREALDELMPIVYDQLRVLARDRFRSERAGHTLQTTALVNEAFIRLVDADISWSDRVHFFAVVARTMRRALVDHARARSRHKRGGDAVRVTLDERTPSGEARADGILLVDEAFARLAAQDARKSEVLELQVFGGLSQDEIAEAVGVSTATVRRDLTLAKAWLKRELAAESP